MIIKQCSFNGNYLIKYYVRQVDRWRYKNLELITTVRLKEWHGEQTQEQGQRPIEQNVSIRETK